MLESPPLPKSRVGEFAWSGVVDMTLDWAPLVGVTGEHQNVYYGRVIAGTGST